MTYSGFKTGSKIFGWMANISDITMTGATLTLIPQFSFLIIKLKIVASQGDRLQVFYLQCNIINAAVLPTYPSIDFDYPSLVQFDEANLPNQVYVVVQIGGAVYLSDNMQTSFHLYVGRPEGGGTWGAPTTARPYSSLYGPNMIFDSSTNKLNLAYQALFAKTNAIQFTLIIHRVSLDANPDTGIALRYSSLHMFDTTLVRNTYDATYNRPVVGNGQALVGLLGYYGLVTQQRSVSVTCVLAVSFTSVQSIPVEIRGMKTISETNWFAFYVVDCDSSCLTCSGSLATQCLTCPGSLSALNGVCTCPNGQYASSDNSNFICSSCDSNCLTCSGSAATQCLTCTGGRAALNGACNCAAGQYVSSDVTHFLCSNCDASCLTCNGPLASNCLTCPSGSPANGVCSAETIICDASCSTCSGSAATQCLTCPGGLTALNGACTCPTGYVVSSDNFNFLCTPSSSSQCPTGCQSCSSPTFCTSCRLGHRVYIPDANHLCPCLEGYYENTNGFCVGCPRNQHCRTCHLSGGIVVCDSCACSHYREKVGDSCDCIAGYQEDPINPGRYCQKITTT